MSRVASASKPTTTFPSIQRSKIQTRCYMNPCNSVLIPSTQLCSSHLSLTSSSFAGDRVTQRSIITCRSSTGPGTPGSGDNESRNVLDAFFLEKALAEVLNERIESTIGEFLSTVGGCRPSNKTSVGLPGRGVGKGQKSQGESGTGGNRHKGFIPKSTAVSAKSVVNGTVLSFTLNCHRISANSSSYNPAIPAANTDHDPAKNE